jgi:hypothetical protein
MTRRAVTRDVLLATVVLLAAPAAASPLVDFARCISRAGATYYTADWCPHCQRQNRMFGNALGYVRTVDCTDGCDEVRSFPTWTFRDGSRIAGVATLEALAGRTGCRLGADDAESGSTRTPDAAAPNERYIGGAKIIEVPRR